jgi:lipopolysaccharide transport system ATP-binding protein
MNDIAIRADGLGKKYRIGGKQEGYKTLRDTLSEVFMAPFRRAKRLVSGQGYGADEKDRTIWALKDVSFQIKRGEVVGVIGKNGAGKTTLLKILSRITEPTEGQAEIYGRVGSLLEVGTGFHPELTGRENVYLNGAILGMRKTEIFSKFDEIVDFAEIEKFIDTPVKYYSSGMYVRLAFAVAAHLEPEILLVDEVLAVGDAAFQKKCLGKMGAVAKEGRTVLFVSHNMIAVQSLCSRGLWLNDGNAAQDGPVASVVASYMRSSMSNLITERVWNEVDKAPGNEFIRLHRVCIRPEKGFPSDLIKLTTAILVEIEFWNLLPGTCLNPNLHFFNEQEVLVFATAPVPTSEPNWCGRPLPVGLFRSVCHIPGDLLNTGVYRVRLFFGKDAQYVVYKHEDILRFEVHDVPERRGASFGKIDGAVRPLLRWITELEKSDGEATAPAE